MKDEFYLKIAKVISEYSKCLRSHFGVVIVKNDMIIGTGYNGPARGVPHCDPCKRAEFPSGQGYVKCNAVHAEANAILQSGGRSGCLGAVLYIGSHNRKFDGTKYNQGMGDFCCDNCARLIVNAGIDFVCQEEFFNDPFQPVPNGKPFVAKYNITSLVQEGKLW
jgi:dCMP deaminase